MVLVVVIAASVMLVLSNPLAAFTMGDDQRMLVDLGLATVFLAGAILAAFLATSVLGREIANRTALTVVSKPVGRPIFMIGKFLGVLGSLLVACMIMTLVFMLVEMHAVIQTVRDPIHVPVVVFGIGGAVLTAAAAVWCNYFYGMSFTSTALILALPVLAVSYGVSLNFDAEFAQQDLGLSFKGNLWLAVAALTTCVAMLAAIAVTVSTRLGQLMTLAATIGLFVLGLLSDWIFGRSIRGMESEWLARASEKGLVESVEVVDSIHRTTGEITENMTTVERATVPLTEMANTSELLGWSLMNIGYAMLPNFQILWLSDAVTQGVSIPSDYLIKSMTYGILYAAAAVCVGIVLFQRRDLG